MQEAVAAGLEQMEKRKFLETQREEYYARRQVLVDAFDKIGMRYTLPEGTYFLLLVSGRLIGWRVTRDQHQKSGYLETDLA